MKRIWIRRAVVLALAMLTVFALTVNLAPVHVSVMTRNSPIGSLEALVGGMEEALLDASPLLMGLLLMVLCWCYSQFLFVRPTRSVGEYLLACFLAFWLLMSISTLQTDSISILWVNETQVAKALCSMIGLVPLWLSIIRAVEIGLKWLTKQKPVSVSHPMLIPFCVMMVVWLPQAVIRYPGGMVFDTVHQLREFFGDLPYYNLNPPVHTALLGLLVRFADCLGNPSFGLFLVSLLQMAALAWILSWLLYLLQRQKAPAPLYWALFVLFVFSPLYSAYATTILKDSACSIAMLLFMIQTMLLLVHPDWFWEHRGRGMMLWMLSGFLAILMRKNGIAMVVPTAIAVGIFSLFRRTERNGGRRKYLPLVCGVAVILAAQGTIELATVAFGINDGNMRDAFSLPFQQTARVLRDQEDVPAEEIEIINRVLDAEVIVKNYDSFSADRVKRTYRQDVTTQKMLDYTGVWAKQLLRYPGSYVDAFFGMTHSIFSPVVADDTIYEMDSRGTVNEGEWKMEKWLNSTPFSKFRYLLCDFYELMFKLPGIGLFLNLGANSCLVLILGFYTLRKRKELWLLWLPIWICLVLLAFSPLTCTRYALPIFYGIPVLLTAACEVRRESEQMETEEQ